VQEMILNANTLPDVLYRRISADKVRVSEENGAIILTPVPKLEPTNLLGLLSDDKFTTENYLAQKRQDKELDLNTFCGCGVDLEMTVDSFLAMTHDDKELDE